MEIANFIYDKMVGDSNYLEEIMGSIYDELKTTPDESKKEILLGLGELAQKMLATEKEFVFNYIHGENLLFRISKKEEDLEMALQETRLNIRSN